MFAAMMLGGMVIDALIGWPGWLFARIGHPVTWLGGLLSWAEVRFNHGAWGMRLAVGVLVLLALCTSAGVPAVLVQMVLPEGVLGTLMGALLAYPLIAGRALHDHVRAVAQPLAAGDVAAARMATALIVGRDTQVLDAAGLSRASLESLAENTSDGVVAPVFWGVVAGLPGIAIYKAINTADSMIGHRTDRYEAFGKASARLDDVVNWLPARLTAVLFVLAAPWRAGSALKALCWDAGKHRSPNAGWPEAAMAAALGVRLSGPRVYGAHVTDEPWVFAAGRDPDAGDISRGLHLYWRALILFCVALAGLAWATSV